MKPSTTQAKKINPQPQKKNQARSAKERKNSSKISGEWRKKEKKMKGRREIGAGQARRERDKEWVGEIGEVGGWAGKVVGLHFVAFGRDNCERTRSLRNCAEVISFCCEEEGS